MRVLLALAILVVSVHTAAAQPASAPTSPGPTPPAATSTVGGLLAGELGLALGTERVGLLSAEGQAGLVFHRKAAVYAAGCLGFGGSADGAIFIGVGIGGRMWFGRTFVDARVERLALTAFDCEDDCNIVGTTKLTAGVGVELFRGRVVGAQLLAKAMRVSDAYAAGLYIGGYLHR